MTTGMPVSREYPMTKTVPLSLCPKYPLKLRQISRLTGRPIHELHDAVRAGRLRLTTFFDRTHRVTQADLEAWLRSEGLMTVRRGVIDGDQ